MNIRVGRKVVFVGPNMPVNRFRQNVPVNGQVYTVRALAEIMGIPAILLDEVRNEPRQWSDGWYELHIKTEWFRPVVERKTDISVFTEILRKATKPAPALAQSLHQR